jgi:GTP cyclohydrolase II
MLALMDTSTDAHEAGLNGGPDALAVDRAIVELRRGRAIAIEGEGRTLVIAALEAASSALLDKLLALSDETALLVTAERVQAASLNATAVGPVAVSVRNADDLAALRVYGGIAGFRDPPDPALTVSSWSGSTPLLTAAFRLAKASRLIPALIGFETERLDDASVARVTLGALRVSADLNRSTLIRVSESLLPLAGAENARIALFRDEHSDGEHVAVVIGEPGTDAAVPVRLHSACLTGDVLGSLRCDCGEQLKTAVERIAELGAGVLLYLDQEGRGIGLANKLRAYSIQDSGVDTVDADRHLGFSADERTYDVAAAILKNLGINKVQLMTNNPHKIEALREQDIDVVGRLALVTNSNSYNERYLRAKREKAGHLAEDTGS